MLTNLILSIVTSLPFIGVLSGVAVAGIGGAWLGLFPIPWGMIARIVGQGSVIAVAFVFGIRVADERHEMQSLKNKLEIKETDLKNEQDARKVDLTVIKELSAEKEKAERNRDELSDYIAKLPTANQCIATPDLLKRLHKSR